MTDGRLSVALAQIDPALGDRGRNLERHREWVKRAAEAGARLLVFPELSLTGYFLKDLVPESAIQLDSYEMRDLAALSSELDIVLGTVIESPDHRYFNASLYFSQGELVHMVGQPPRNQILTGGVHDVQQHDVASASNGHGLLKRARK